MAHKLDEDRFARAKALISKLCSPPSLQRLCSDFIFKLAGATVTEWKKSGENIFDFLPNNLRNQLLNLLLSSDHLDNNGKNMNKQLTNDFYYELTCMLMNQMTVDINYQEYNTSKLLMSEEQFCGILTNAAQKCPKLELLAVQGHDYSDGVDFIGAGDAMSPRSGIQHLLHLEDLTYLGIAGLWYWKDDGLCKLFSHLKKLVYLEILIHTNVTVSGFQNIHQLKELEEFHFAMYNTEDFPPDNHEWIYEYCAENLPSLKLIGATTEGCLTRENVHAFSPLRSICPSITGTSRLEFLHTECSLPDADFPNLQHLYFQGPIHIDIDKFYPKFSSFSNLAELNLDKLTFDVVAKMLELVGKQLKVLYIDKNDGSIDFFQILHLCPNLEKFHQNILVNTYGTTHAAVRPSKYQALVTKHNVRLLKVFRAVFDKKELEGLFELILFAPLLEDLILAQFTFSQLDCLSIIEGHFCNLRSVLFLDMALGPSCSMDDFGLMVKCLACSCPCLGRFQFFHRDNQDGEASHFYEKWKSEQHAAHNFLRHFNELDFVWAQKVVLKMHFGSSLR